MSRGCSISRHSCIYKYAARQGIVDLPISWQAITDIGVKYFGEFEYVFGSFKLAFITMLILLMVVLDTITRKYTSVNLTQILTLSI